MGMEKRINMARKNPKSRYGKQIDKLEKSFPVLTPPPSPEQSPHSEASEPILLSPNVATILASHRFAVYCCEWSADGRKLATGSADGSSIIWEMDNGVANKHIVCGNQVDVSNNDVDISSISWNPSGSLLAVSSFDTTVKIFNSHGKQITVLNGHTHNVFSVLFDPTGSLLLTGSADHTAIVWNASACKQIIAFPIHTEAILDMAWKDSTTFATASADGNIGLCQTSGTHILLKGHEGDVNSLRFNKSGNYLVSGGMDMKVILWDLTSDKSFVLEGHTGGVSIVRWKPNSDDIFATGSLDGTIRIWDAPSKQCIHIIEAHEHEIYTIDFSPDGKFIASGSTDQQISVANASTGEILVKYAGNSVLYDVKWDPTSHYIAAAFDDSTVAVIPAYIQCIFC